MKFKWKQYCLDRQLPSETTKEEAYQDYISYLLDQSNKQEKSYTKYEPFSLNYNYNKNIAIFCHTIPTPDKDSGSNRLNEIIKILIDLQYKIYYFTHTNLPKEPKYSEALEKLGVHIFVINPRKDVYCDILFEQCVREGVNFDIAIFYFYDMFHNYAERIKKITPTIKTIVDSVDVHWLRLSRGGNLKLKDKENEKTCYNNADVVFAVTENDKNEILKECPESNIKILSNIHHFTEHAPNYQNNLLFVGGSNHTPNIQAAIDAIDIFETFIKEHPQYSESKLFLVGSSFTKNILDRITTSKSTINLGHLNQSDLENIYQSKIKGALCPITWGAGIKGKICEAITHNIPVLTTNLGNEGIDLVHKESGYIFNSQKEAIKCIYELFNNKIDNIKQITKLANQKLKLLISKDSAEKVLKGTLRSQHIVLSIASYNKSNLLERCVHSIIQNTIYPNYSIHITSNGCTDNTKEIIKNLQNIYGSEKIKSTLNVTNKHFIEAHNDVINTYINSDIVLINNDMEFIQNSWLNSLYSAAYSAGYIGCAGGKTLDYSLKVSEFGAYIFKDGSGINCGRGQNPSDPDMNKVKYTGYVSGCLMYMRRDAINKFGALDIRYYPCYYEDSDWQYNLHINGYKTIVTPKCEVLHIEGASSGSSSDKYNFKNTCMNNNKLKFLKKFKNLNIEMYNI